MKKRVLTTMLLSTIFASSIYANGDKRGNCDMKNSEMKCHQMEKKDIRKKVHNPFMRALHQLQLDDTQKSKIKELMQNRDKNIQRVSEAFSKNSFDKDKFVEISLNKHKNMLESRANLIDNIYKILTDKQKEELKVLLDLDTKRAKNKGMKNDKYCNGRG